MRHAMALQVGALLAASVLMVSACVGSEDSEDLPTPALGPIAPGAVEIQLGDDVYRTWDSFPVECEAVDGGMEFTAILDGPGRGPATVIGAFGDGQTPDLVALLPDKPGAETPFWAIGAGADEQQRSGEFVTLVVDFDGGYFAGEGLFEGQLRQFVPSTDPPTLISGSFQVHCDL